jgi:ribosomal protein L40E
MALITCKDCGTDISPSAAACPKCGAPIIQPKPKQKTRWYTWVFGAFFTAMVIGMVVGGTAPQKKEPPPTPAEAAQRAQENTLDAAATVALRAFKAETRNPERFSVDQVLSMDKTQAVCMKVRAENGFGGLNVVQIVVATSPAFRVATDEDAGFTKLWNKNCAGQPGRDITQISNRMLR